MAVINRIMKPDRKLDGIGLRGQGANGIEELEAVVDVVDVVVPPVGRGVSGIEVIEDGAGRFVPGRFCNASDERSQRSSMTPSVNRFEGLKHAGRNTALDNGFPPFGTHHPFHHTGAELREVPRRHEEDG